MRAMLIGRYAAGAEEIASALDGVAAAGLDSPAPDGGWTIREVVQHLADSEMTSAIRLRRLLTEEHPRLDAYDEAAWARVLRYRDRAVEPALAAMAAARATTVQILELLDEAAWKRWGTHSESGHYTVDTWLEIYAGHVRDHAAQIRAIRTATGT